MLAMKVQAMGCSSRKSAPVKVLVIDDDLAVLEALKLVLVLEGFDVVEAESGDVAVATARTDAFDVAITDLRMPGMSGLETLAALRQIDPTLPVIIASGFLAEEVAAECLTLGALAYIRKPFDLEDLLSLVQRALHERVGTHGPAGG
jgi:DNA-binding NtrC family response regulator